MSSKRQSYGASFLPSDYVDRKNEGRSGLVMLGLSCIVMFGIAAAFFVTNRQWTSVKSLQLEINRQYAQEAQKIEQLKTLENQKVEMLEKADVTVALIERVPRSILLAELINRMPGDLTLTDFDLSSKKINDAPAEKKDSKPQPRSLAGKTTTSRSGKSAPAKAKEKEADKPKPPRYEHTVVITGLSRTDQEVADYTAALQQCALLERVEFKFSTDTAVDKLTLRKFRIDAQIRASADAREIEPLHIPRLPASIGENAFGKKNPPEDKKGGKTPGKGLVNVNIKE
ncbi:MAG: PilN domain-containing protein [Phycisphaerales bacterium]